MIDGKKVIWLIQSEIKKLEDDNPKETSWNDIGIIMGLERAIELIKVQAAIEVVEGSVMHNLSKAKEPITKSPSLDTQKEYALIGMSKVDGGYAATCCEFGDEKDGDTQFQAVVGISGDADSLYAYLSNTDWQVLNRVALISCWGFHESGAPISPIMIDYREKHDY